MDTTSDLFSDGTHPHSLGEATRTVHPHDISFLVWGGFFLTPTGVKTRLQRMAPSPKFVVGSCDACKQVGRWWSWESNAVVPPSWMLLIVSNAFQFLLAISKLVCTSVSYDLYHPPSSPSHGSWWGTMNFWPSEERTAWIYPGIYFYAWGLLLHAQSVHTRTQEYWYLLVIFFGQKCFLHKGC